MSCDFTHQIIDTYDKNSSSEKQLLTEVLHKAFPHFIQYKHLIMPLWVKSEFVVFVVFNYYNNIFIGQDVNTKTGITLSDEEANLTPRITVYRPSDHQPLPTSKSYINTIRIFLNNMVSRLDGKAYNYNSSNLPFFQFLIHRQPGQHAAG